MNKNKVIDTLRRIQQNRYTVNHLLILDECEEKAVTMSDLAYSAKLSAAALSCLCDTLVEAKLVRRGTDKSDRRVVTIKTTPVGSKILADIIGE